MLRCQGHRDTLHSLADAAGIALSAPETFRQEPLHTNCCEAPDASCKAEPC